MPMPKLHVKAADFDPSLLHFGQVRKYKDSQQPHIPITYNNSQLLLQTPTMPMPFGLGMYIPEGSKTGEKNIDLSFNSPSDEVRAFKEKLMTMDALVRDAALQNSEALFGKKKSIEVLEDNQYTIVKEAKQKEYGYSMKVKWPKLETPTFWAKTATGDFLQKEESYCTGGSTGQVIMELRPIYSVNGKFGVKWLINQVLVETVPATLNGCGFGAIAAPAESAKIKKPESPEAEYPDYGMDE